MGMRVGFLTQLRTTSTRRSRRAENGGANRQITDVLGGVLLHRARRLPGNRASVGVWWRRERSWRAARKRDSAGWLLLQEGAPAPGEDLMDCSWEWVALLPAHHSH
jgi:hypothetical protein